VGHYLDIADIVNALFAAAALPFFGYLAYHEYLSYEWDEVYTPLRWLGATVVLAGGIYFAVDRVPYLSGALIKMVADQSAWVITELFGFHVNAGAIDYGTNQLWFRAGSGHEQVRVPFNAVDEMDEGASHINIILACTALQSMIVFIGGILSTRAPNDRRLKAFMITVPVIYLLNLLRNAIVAWLSYSGTMDFDPAHNYVGKGGSLVALVFLAVATFTILPEMHDNILGLFDITKRKRGQPYPPPREPPNGEGGEKKIKAPRTDAGDAGSPVGRPRSPDESPDVPQDELPDDDESNNNNNDSYNGDIGNTNGDDDNLDNNGNGDGGDDGNNSDDDDQNEDKDERGPG